MSLTTRLSLILLAASVALTTGAWQLQRKASNDLAGAIELQQKEIDEPDRETPSLEDYRAIIASLERATEIRRRIESDLARIEATVDQLRQRQVEAGVLTDEAGSRLGEIAGALGAAARSSASSLDELRTLGSRIRTSAGLARLIAEELEELDRRFGPTAPGKKR